MAESNIEAFLKTCPVPDSGCFAGSPDSFSLITSPAVADLEAMVVQTGLERAAEAAMSAGQKGIPLEQATYTTAVLDIGRNAIDNGPDRGVLDPGAERPLDEVRDQVVRCANMCGRNAVSCPVYRELT